VYPKRWGGGRCNGTMQDVAECYRKHCSVTDILYVSVCSGTVALPSPCSRYPSVCILCCCQQAQARFGEEKCGQVYCTASPKRSLLMVFCGHGNLVQVMTDRWWELGRVTNSISGTCACMDAVSDFLLSNLRKSVQQL